MDRKVQIQTRTLNEKNQLLKKEIIEKERIEKDLWSKNQKLEEALSEVSVLSGLLPICSGCKKIRDDKGYWNQIDSYFHKHSNLDFSHGLCPDCAQELYPEYYRKK
jgi:DNA repair exonuclease SbcCD ATPase subunit